MSGLMLFPIETLFRVGGFAVPSYAALLSAGMGAGAALALSEARRRQLEAGVSECLIAAGLAGGLCGAAIYGVAQRALNQMLGVSNPVGLAAYGGLLGGAGAMLLYARWRSLSWWPYADAFTPAVLLAIAIVRIGCFLNWDDYGVHTSVPWAVDGGDGPRHPTQIYLSLAAFLLFLLAFTRRKRKYPPGAFFLAFAVAEAALRFSIESLREVQRYALALSGGQWTAIAIIVVCSALLKPRLGDAAEAIGSGHPL